jgi:hypothetical protein
MELIDGEFDAGYHRAVWNAAGLSSGMYYCRMQCGDFVTARKLMLIK